MTQPGLDANTKALIAQARRLGLTWTLSTGTVFATPTSPNNTRVTMDGDTDPIRAISMLGITLVGTRVYVITIPPQGQYIVGYVSPLLNNANVQIFSANGTWNQLAGVQLVWARIAGGGGAGGGVIGAASGNGAGGGGGGGGYVEKWYAASALAATQAVVIGSGGTGVSGAAGNAGTASTFAGLTAGGGGGGGVATSSTGNVAGAKGAGGTATGGDLNIPGEEGDLGVVVAGAHTFQGRGGGSLFGPQTGASVSTGGPGLNGTGFGTGGSGAIANTTSRAGGAGTAGFCIVTSFI